MFRFRFRFDVRCLALLIVLAPLGAPAAEPTSANPVARLPPGLTAVVSCASAQGDRHVRVVVFERGFEHVSSEVYLQWIEASERGSRLVKSVRLAEPSSGMWSVRAPVIVSGDSCVMRLDATHTYSGELASFRLEPGVVGRYSIRRVGAP